MSEEAEIEVPLDAHMRPIIETPQERLWTLADAAAYLRLSIRKVRLMTAVNANDSGSIPHVKLGRLPRFIPDDVKAWAAAGFPPAATFNAWKQRATKQRHQRRNVIACTDRN